MHYSLAACPIFNLAVSLETASPSRERFSDSPQGKMRLLSAEVTPAAHRSIAARSRRADRSLQPFCRLPPWQPHRELGPSRIGRRDVDRSIVGKHDLLRDIKPEAQPRVVGILSGRAAERIEQSFEAGRVDRPAPVVHLDGHRIGITERSHRHLAVHGPMLQRVGNEVRNQLRNPFCVDLSDEIAIARDREVPVGIHRD